MNVVIVGHVDHGKSTILGRLLVDINHLPKGKLEQVKELCRRNSKPFEYAFLIDALKDEQTQGITIDSARCFLKTKRRRYIIIDTPGHIEFLRNVVTGASRAEAALLVIDATEGIQENSRRHAFMLSMLGIKQVSILINKMDLVDYDEKIFKSIMKNYLDFLEKIDIKPNSFIPVSGMKGDNITSLSKNTAWFRGQTVLEILDEFKHEKPPEDKPFRMPVQAVYKFTRDEDDRRIVAGTIDSGRVNVGDEVIFYPSGKKSVVESIEVFNGKKQMSIGAGYATGFTLREQIYVRRGEIVTLSNQPEPKVSSKIKVNLFWLGKQPMQKKKKYLLKLCAAKVGVKIEEIIKIIDASSLKNKKTRRIEKHDVAECILRLDKTIAFDLVTEIAPTSRFVIVDNYEITGGGIIRESLEDRQSQIRKKVFIRNYKWQRGVITQTARAEKYNQKSVLILITGQKHVGKKKIAKALEKRLFEEGKIVYFLGIGNILYGVNADIKGTVHEKREEHLRRLAEVSHIMLDAGVILIVTAVELSQKDLEIMKTVVNPDMIETVWVGKNITTDIEYDLHLPTFQSKETAASIMKEMLQEQDIIFRPW